LNVSLRIDAALEAPRRSSRRFLIFSALAIASAWLFVPAAARAQNTICKPLPIAEPLDQTDESTAELDIQILGAAAVEHVQASGPVKTRITLSRDGSVRNEILSMDLTGTSTLGPFKISISAPPRPPSVGGGTLDPTTGRIDSFFDVFFDITVMPPNKPSQVYSNIQQPAHMELTKICPVHGGEQIVARQRAGDEVTIFAVTGQQIAIIRNIKHTIGNPPPTRASRPAGRTSWTPRCSTTSTSGSGFAAPTWAGPVVVERRTMRGPRRGSRASTREDRRPQPAGPDPVCGKIIITLNPFRAHGLICERQGHASHEQLLQRFHQVQLSISGYASTRAAGGDVLHDRHHSAVPLPYNLNVGKGARGRAALQGDCDATAAADRAR
jgi:hypothetical protein